MPSTIIVSFAGSEELAIQSSTAEAKFIHWSDTIVTLEDISNPVKSKTLVMVSGSGMTIAVVISHPERSWRRMVCYKITVVTITTVGAWNVPGSGVVEAWLPTV